MITPIRGPEAVRSFGQTMREQPRISSHVSRTAARHADSPASMAPPNVDQVPPRWTLVGQLCSACNDVMEVSMLGVQPQTFGCGSPEAYWFHSCGVGGPAEAQSAA